jgi:hypothetical protein
MKQSVVTKFFFAVFAYVSCLLPAYANGDWIDERIKEELKEFAPHSISKKDLLDMMDTSKDHHLGLLLITMVDQRICFIPDALSDNQNKRAIAIVNFLKELYKNKRIPNITFIISTEDSLGNLEKNIPIFVFAKNKNYHNQILFPDFSALNSNDELIKSCKTYTKNHPWEKKENKVFWRGRTTGSIYTKENFRTLPRVRAVYMSAQYPDLIDATFTLPLSQNSETIIDILKKEARNVVKFVPIEDHFAYKYLLDIDGNSCTYERCRWILLSNSVLLKPDSNNIQWYYHLLKPYENYVPLNDDLSNMVDIVNWLKQNDAKAKEIMLKANRMANTIFTKEAIQKYVIRLLEEYQKILK